MKLKKLIEAYGKDNEDPKTIDLANKYFNYLITDIKKHNLDEKDMTLVLARVYTRLKSYLDYGKIKNWKKY